jgi:hypothetical protein
MFRAITLVIITTAASLILTAMPSVDAIAFVSAMPSVNHIDAVVAAAILGARAERVLRLCELPAFLGVQRSQINEAIKKGLLHPRPAYPGARAQVVTETEVISLQQAAKAEAAAKVAAGEKPIEIAPNRGRKRVARETAEKRAKEVTAA